ncbi:hypothetical protein KR222_002528 [Zaprionus bogoriensis]|nr:hypothetical protein KR222_002528 [Zaprionus bogoriensis]
MGPYPLSDSTNLLGPTSTGYAGGGGGGAGVGVAGSSACYTNYGTNIQTPVPNRKHCYYNESDYGRDDGFRRHSAHGRIVHSTSRAEEKQQQQQQQQHQQQQQQQQQHHATSSSVCAQSQSQHQPCYTTLEYVHCSYEKDIVCDQAPPSSHSHEQDAAAAAAAATAAIVPHCHQTTSTRKHSHSHSPHHSRHTSPHSHHSHQGQHQGQGQGQGQSQSQSQSHSHHHHYRRRRRQHSVAAVGGSGSLPGAHSHHQAVASSSAAAATGHHSARHVCSSRRHRSVTDVSCNSINACQDAACADREVQEIMVRKSCCSASRTELAQYFAEDLYGSSSRRPSSCCTSSDYCYQTDSTSLYGSRSSLSRNNSIKSASAAMRKQQRLQARQPSYTSISLRGLNASRPNSQLGSLTSIFDRAKQIASEQEQRQSLAMTPSRGSTLERHSSKGALSNAELPEYACSPSPIRWSFLADGKSPTEFELEGAVGGVGAEAATTSASSEKLDAWHVPEPEVKPCRKLTSSNTESSGNWKSSLYDDGPSTSAAAAARKRRSSNYHCEFEESTTVLFHQDQEGEPFNNCCNNYIQCNTYLDQDLQITSEDIHQYLSKGNPTVGDVLNNSKNYPFQPSNALEFQYKNNFQQGNNNTNTTNTASSDAGECFQRYERSYQSGSSKETNLNQNSTGGAAEPLSPSNINLSSSSNNINIVFSSGQERNANEVKFINNRSSGGGGAETQVVSSEAHHAGYLPYTYPSYDYTNMSGNSHFDKPLGIDELPKEFAGRQQHLDGGGSTTSEHSSSLHFDCFDAASEHNLLSQPMSPGSPASASVNPAGDGYLHHMHHSQLEQQQHHHYHGQYSHAQPHPHPHSHTHTHPHSHAHAHSTQPYGNTHGLTEEQFRLGNALKKVRKRARKYTDFLRKK